MTMIDDEGAGDPDGTTVRRHLHAAWRWDGVGLEIAIAELPGVLILVPTLADAPLAMRKRITRELGLAEADFDIDLRQAD
jgi:hypothetical protein